MKHVAEDRNPNLACEPLHVGTNKLKLIIKLWDSLPHKGDGAKQWRQTVVIKGILCSQRWYILWLPVLKGNIRRCCSCLSAIYIATSWPLYYHDTRLDGLIAGLIQYNSSYRLSSDNTTAARNHEAKETLAWTLKILDLRLPPLI